MPQARKKRLGLGRARHRRGRNDEVRRGEEMPSGHQRREYGQRIVSAGFVAYGGFLCERCQEGWWWYWFDSWARAIALSRVPTCLCAIVATLARDGGTLRRVEAE